MKKGSACFPWSPHSSWRCDLGSCEVCLCCHYSFITWRRWVQYWNDRYGTHALETLLLRVVPKSGGVSEVTTGVCCVLLYNVLRADQSCMICSCCCATVSNVVELKFDLWKL